MQPLRKTHFLTILQLLINGFGLFIFAGSAVGLFFAGLMSLLGDGLLMMDVFPIFSLAWTALTVAALLLPSLALAVMRLMGREERWRRLKSGLRWSSLLMLAWPLFLVLGHFLTQVDELSALLVPPVQVMAVVIPLWWFFELGRRGLHGIHSQRNWGVMSTSLVVTPAVIIVIQLALLVILGIGAVAWLSNQPHLLEELNRTAQRLMSAQLDPETTLRILRPYLQQPLVLYAGFAIVAGVVPLLEELLKPLALWGLASRRFTPADGFVTGMICGSGFALIESLGMLSSAAVGADWVALVTGRLGTGLLHIVTAGIAGYGLASAWSCAQYARLAGSFCIAVLLHGIWNFLAILAGIAPLFENQVVRDNLVMFIPIHTIAPAALVILAAALFLILVGTNRRLRADQQRAGPE
ncbi:MAG TPA: PrsW family glutamic-type intramembrane protease [Levilinea sp.]|nr:PrsW family glutamic-type intramembrane protease [Levilinea sp.]